MGITLSGAAKRGTLFLAFSQICAVATHLSSIILISRGLGPSEFAVFSLYAAGGVLLQQLLFGPIAQVIGRYFSSDSWTPLHFSYLATVKGQCWAASTISVSILVLVCSTCLFAGSSHLIPAFAVSVGVSVVTGLAGCNENMLLAQRRRHEVAMAQLAGQVSKLLILGLAMSINQLTTSLAAQCSLLVSATTSLLMVTRFLGELRVMPYKPPQYFEVTCLSPESRTLISYGWPFTAWAFISWIQSYADRWIVNALVPRHELGIYLLNQQLTSYPLAMSFGLICQTYVPTMFRVADCGGVFAVREALHFNLRLVSLIAATGLAYTYFLSLCAAFIVDRVFGRAYSSDSNNIILIGIWITANYTFQQLGIAFQLIENTRELLTIRIGVGLLTLGAQITGAHLAGVPGMCVGAFVALVVGSLVSHFVSWRAGASRPQS